MSYYLLDNEDATLGIKSNEKSDKKQPCFNRMSDGRFLTDYRPNCIVNQELHESLAKKNITNSSYESRMYIQNRGTEIIEEQYNKNYEKLAQSTPCKISGSENVPIPPERYVIRCDAVSCVKKEVDPNGIGDGRNYF
jgi:hypothetical protein